MSRLACLLPVLLAVPAQPATLTLPTLTVGATTSINDTVGSGNTCAGFLDERLNLGALGIRPGLPAAHGLAVR